jgi:virulence-associated protein VapD
MDTEAVKKSHGNPNWRNGYTEARQALAQHGLDHQHGSVYFDNETITAASTVLAVQDVCVALDVAAWPRRPPGTLFDVDADAA